MGLDLRRQKAEMSSEQVGLPPEPQPGSTK